MRFNDWIRTVLFNLISIFCHTEQPTDGELRAYAIEQVRKETIYIPVALTPESGGPFEWVDDPVRIYIDKVQQQVMQQSLTKPLDDPSYIEKLDTHAEIPAIMHTPRLMPLPSTPEEQQQDSWLIEEVTPFSATVKRKKVG